MLFGSIVAFTVSVFAKQAALRLVVKQFLFVYILSKRIMLHLYFS